MTGYEEEDIRKYLTTVLKLSFGTGVISLSFSDIDLSQFL